MTPCRGKTSFPSATGGIPARGSFSRLVPFPRQPGASVCGEGSSSLQSPFPQPGPFLPGGGSCGTPRNAPSLQTREPACGPDAVHIHGAGFFPPQSPEGRGTSRPDRLLAAWRMADGSHPRPPPPVPGVPGTAWGSSRAGHGMAHEKQLFPLLIRCPSAPT